MIKNVEIGILTAKSISDKDSGRAILELLVSKASVYSPEKCSNYEPIKNSFDPSDIEGALAFWVRPFLWRRSRPKLLGQAWFSSRPVQNKHSRLLLSLNGKASFDLQVVWALLDELDGLFGIDFACIHVVTDLDKHDVSDFELRFAPFQAGITTHDLRKGLPDFTWAMVLGRPYRKLFGDSLLQAPAYKVKEMSEPGGAVYVQLTENFTDVDVNREEYFRKQAEVKEHLNCNAFQSPDGGECQVPDFGF